MTQHEIGMRLLIYGFGPYKRFNDNITAKIIRKLPGKRGLKKVVFPVRFQKRQFIEVLKQYRPDAVLGLGQSSKRRHISVEKRAVNRMRGDWAKRSRPITKTGPGWLRVNLNLDGGRRAEISYNAGDYVCNYSMYVILDHLSRYSPAARFGFIHIPRHYNPEKASRFLAKVMRDLEGSSPQSV